MDLLLVSKKTTLQGIQMGGQVACSDFPPPRCDNPILALDNLYYYKKKKRSILPQKAFLRNKYFILFYK